MSRSAMQRKKNLLINLSSMSNQQLARLFLAAFDDKVMIHARSDEIPGTVTAVPFQAASKEITSAERAHKMPSGVIDQHGRILGNIFKDDRGHLLRKERIRIDLHRRSADRKSTRLNSSHQ